MASTACCVAMGTGSKWETGTDDCALCSQLHLCHIKALWTPAQYRHNTTHDAGRSKKTHKDEYEEYFIYSPAGSLGITLSDKQKDEIKTVVGGGETWADGFLPNWDLISKPEHTV